MQGFNWSNYTREEVENMDPLYTYYDIKSQISEVQNSLLGDIDLNSLASQLGSGSGSSQSNQLNEAENNQEEEVEVLSIISRSKSKQVSKSN
jgi:hypothetical protein